MMTEQQLSEYRDNARKAWFNLQKSIIQNGLVNRKVIRKLLDEADKIYIAQFNREKADEITQRYYEAGTL